ncbi:hypothetical protein [Cellulomonas sp. URHB0016]
MSVDFPDLAAGQAIKNAARRLETAFGLPADAAFAMATATVDPSEVRNQIDAKSPFGHLQAIQTPAGYFLLAQQTRVWTSMISGDGGNGRSRYKIQTATGAGARPRPWPIGRHHMPAVVDYHTPSLADLATAVRLSASEIRSHDLLIQIATNPRGVWNPPVVVLARARVSHTDGTLEERWFLHTIEGSTRVEACHELTEVDAADPLEHSHEPLAYLRQSHQTLTDRFSTTPTSSKTLAAARGAHMPALIVVGAVEDDMVTPITANFPMIVNDYVESVHVQPRPFTEVAQSNVIGERFVLRLQTAGRLAENDAAAILGRDPNVAGKPSVRAATLVRAACDAKNDPVLREFLITEPGARLTKAKRATLIAPLVVRQFDQAADSAERALMRAFTPDILMSTWNLTGVSSDELRKDCVADVLAGNSDSSALAELVARGGPALCASGLLLGDQGSTVDGITELRGSVEKVVEALAKRVGGVHLLADAIAWADGERREKPRQFDIDGTVKLDPHGDPLHFPPTWQRGNKGVRALAFTDDGEIPEPKAKRTTPTVVKQTPEERYKSDEVELLERLLAAQTTLMDLVAAKDEHGAKLIEKLGLTSAAVYETLPSQLSKIYARFGNEDDVLSAFDEDELPDGDVGSGDEDERDDEFEDELEDEFEDEDEVNK